MNGLAFVLAAVLFAGPQSAGGIGEIVSTGGRLPDNDTMVIDYQCVERTDDFQIDSDVKLPALITDATAEFDGSREFLFSAYKFKGVLNEKELEERNPMMLYTGNDGSYTYALLFGEDPSESLYENEAGLQKYYDAMNYLIDNRNEVMKTMTF